MDYSSHKHATLELRIIILVLIDIIDAHNTHTHFKNTQKLPSVPPPSQRSSFLKLFFPADTHTQVSAHAIKAHKQLMIHHHCKHRKIQNRGCIM